MALLNRCGDNKRSAGCIHTRRTTHLLSGMAAGAAVSALAGAGHLEMILVGGLFGVLPDFDVMLTPLWPRAHRSAGSHSLLAAVCMAATWYVVALMALSKFGLFDGQDFVVASSVTAFTASFLHAAEDSLTKQGCRLLFPLSRRRLRGPVRYDDPVTNAALSLMALVAILCCCGPHMWPS